MTTQLQTLSFLSINFWGTQPPLQDRLALAERQLRDLDPDVIGMQEVRPMAGKDGPTTADHLADALGYERVFETAFTWADDSGEGGGPEGLAILSRYPIAAHRVTRLPEPRPTEARILLSAAIETPAGRVWCHTTHLHYGLDDGVAREKQVVAIDRVLRQLSAEGAGVQLLCGDFNATPEHDEIRYLSGLTTLEGGRTFYQDAFSRVHPGVPGFTWSAENKRTRVLRSMDIDRRLDYIFATRRRKDGCGTVLDARIVLDERDSSGNCASDHYGVWALMQIAPSPAGPST